MTDRPFGIPDFEVPSVLKGRVTISAEVAASAARLSQAYLPFGADQQDWMSDAVKVLRVVAAQAEAEGIPPAQEPVRETTPAMNAVADAAVKKIWADWFTFHEGHFRQTGIKISAADQMAFYEIAQPVMRSIVAPQATAPSEAELERLRALLQRIGDQAEWVPYPSDRHIINDMLVVGRLERFHDTTPAYGHALDYRMGPIETDERARAAVLAEVVSGETTRRNAEYEAKRDSLPSLQILGDHDLMEPQGATLAAIQALGIKWMSYSPTSGIFSGCTNIPEELPTWIERRT